MKKILHSGEFVNYEGKTIRVSFYIEKHLWVSVSEIEVSALGGTYEVEVWSDAGDALIYDSQESWIGLYSNGMYVNNEGHNVYKYKITVKRNSVGIGGTNPRTGVLNVGVELYYDIASDTEYEDTLTRIITINQK
jgi:hypothetical protein